MRRNWGTLIRTATLSAGILATTAPAVRAADEIHWTFTGPTSATIDWRGTASENTVRYGTAAGSYTQTVTAAQPAAPLVPISSAGPFWEAKITGLQADTLYHYSIAGGPDHTFRTPPPRGSTDPFTILTIGDVGSGITYDAMVPVQQLIAQNNPEFVLVPGDIAYADTKGQQDVDQHYNDAMAWSQDAAYMPAWGNHEHQTPTNACGLPCGSTCSTQLCDDLRNYKGRFDLPNPQTSPGSPAVSCCGEDWYWFDYGNVRFIAYPEPWSGAWADWNAKADTLMDEAQADAAIRFIVTFGHRPAYSSGHHPGDSTLKGYLDALGASHGKYVLSVEAHSHNYERTIPQSGVVHVTVGTGGSNLEQDGSCLWLTCTQPSWSAFRAMYHGALRLRFTGTGIEGAFLCGPSTTSRVNEIDGVRTTCTYGSVIDSFTIGSVAADTTPPAVSVTSPAGGSGVSGTVNLIATASDNVAVSGVQFRRDGVAVGSEDTTAPYNVAWSTLGVTDGTHSLTAVARDAAGNTTTSSSVPVSVQNGGAVGLVVDPTAVFSVPAMNKPAYLVPVQEPTFGTTVTRIANDPTKTFAYDGPPSGSGSWGTDVRHHYQKDQPWNSDGTLMVLQNTGSPSQILLDGETYLPRYGQCGTYGLGDDRWHPSRQYPNVRINVKTTKLEWFDVVGCAQLRSWTLPFSVDYFGAGEGNPSYDGRFAMLHDSTRAFVVDMDPQAPQSPYPNKRIGPAYTLTDCGLASGCAIDWVSISPSGKFGVVSYSGNYIRVFDVNPDTLALTPRPMPSGSPRCSGTAGQGYIYDLGHADMTFNPFDNNEEVIIGQEHCSWSGDTVGGQLIGGVVLTRLRDGVITPLTSPTNEAYPHHISARAFDRPGWVYVGYHPGGGKRFGDEIIAVRMDGSQTVERLAHKRSVFSGCYRCESHAVPSRDGRRVLWASNWAENCGSVCGSQGDIKAYVLDTRALVPADTVPPSAPTGLRLDP